MRALFVSHSFYPQRQWGGFYSRMLMFIEALKQVDQLDMLFYTSADIDTSPASIRTFEASLRQHWHPNLNLFLCPQQSVDTSSRLQSQVKGIWNFFRQPETQSASGIQQIRAFEDCLAREPDLVFVHRLNSMIPAMLTKKPLPPIFFDLDDIEHKKLLRSIHHSERLRTKLYYSKVPALLWGEYQAIRLAHSTFICSEDDRAYLTHQLQLAGIVTIPNSASIPSIQPLTTELNLLFIGTYSYLPNIQAANFLIEQVFPRIRDQLPNARLIIAGSGCQNIRTYEQGIPGVEFAGFVDDLEALYHRVRIVCCPIFVGGGTRVKLIEAAAYGKPIVASRIGAEGLNLRDGQEFLQRDTAVSFAETCIQLLADYDQCKKMGTAAQTAAIKHYDRRNIVQFISQQIYGNISEIIAAS